MHTLPEIIATIQNTINDKNLSVNKTLVESGAGKDFIANMKKGTVPSVQKFSALADYLNVSVDYLLGRTNCPDIVVLDENGEPIIASITTSTDDKEGANK